MMRICFASLWTLLFTTTAFLAQEKPRPDDKKADAGLAAIDRGIEAGLFEVIGRGVEMFNKQADPAGCARLYEGALLAVKPLLGHRPALQKTIEQGIAKARRESTWEDSAFAYRAVLDEVRATINSPKPRELTKPVERKRNEQGFELSDTEKDLFALLNEERRQAGLTPLSANEKLFRAARAHSENMARLDRLYHTLDDKGPGERLAEVGYQSAGWGENIAAGQRTPKEAMASWMSSEGHRANILNERFTEVGLGIAVNQQGIPYYTQVFAAAAR